jgi:hypothetical protein
MPVGEQKELALDFFGGRLWVKWQNGDTVLVDRVPNKPPSFGHDHWALD